jgi:glycosyltransferase involved in cell wall biosynthesis
VTRVHQLLSGAGPHDAITTEAVVFRAQFRAWGFGGRDYAHRIAPGLTAAVEPLERLRVEPDDVLLLHHSAGWPRLGELLALRSRKLLLYHNVTPPSLLWEHAPLVAAQCAAGRSQLAELVAAADVTAADSGFNAGELADLGAEGTIVIPLLVELAALGPPRSGGADPPGPPTVVFVGRLSPHKGQEELIRAFALYRRHRAAQARLTLVGDPISLPYGAHLRALGAALAPGAVAIESGLEPTQLGDRYRAAHVFACTSRHEGFCIPLLEALHFGVPVVARPAGAIPEVLGDAGVLFSDADPAVLAELIHLAAGDAELRTELRRRGAERLRAYAPDQVAGRLREALDAALRAGGAGMTG